MKMYFLLNMGIVQPAMLVYQRVKDSFNKIHHFPLQFPGLGRLSCVLNVKKKHMAKKAQIAENARLYSIEIPLRISTTKWVNLC